MTNSVRKKKLKARHILGVSGGKDSAALSVYLRDRVPAMEYVFCDTGKELPETYDFLLRLEAYLGKHIVRLPRELPGYSDKYDFDHWLEMFGGMLPSKRVRWCTRNLKLKPFEIFVGDNLAYNYVGIRADEFRQGYISHKKNIETVFPFVEDGVDRAQVLDILRDAGLGLPEYYKWRSRSGCYFCFFQRKDEWIGLKENHPELFERAKAYEKDRFKWRRDMSLEELDHPQVIAEIKRTVENRAVSIRKLRSRAPLIEVLDDVRDYEDDEKPCLICHL